jgi:hypothetical protein
MTDNVIQIQSHLRSRDPEKAQAAIRDKQRRERERLEGADAIRAKLKERVKLPRDDVPLMAKNLGNLIAGWFPGRELEIIREIIEEITTAADVQNVISKRKRFIRLPL